MERRRGRIGGLVGSIYATLVFRVATGVVLARSLGPSGRGELAAVQAFGVTATMILGFGMPIAIGRAAAVDDAPESALMGSAVRYALLTAPLALLCAAGGSLLLGGSSSAARTAAFVVIAVAPLNVVTDTQRWIQTARGDLRALGILRAAPFVALCASIGGLWVLDRLTTATALATVIVVELAVNGLGWLLLPVAPARGPELRPLLRFAARSAGSNIAGFGITKADQAILAPVVDSDDLAFYATAANVAALPNGIGQAVSSRTFGDVARSEGRLTTAGAHLRVSTLIAIVLSVALAVGTPFVIPFLYGEEFRGAITPLRILLIGVPALVFSTVGRNQLIALGRPGRASLADGLTLLWVGLGLALTVPAFGIVGAAWTSASSYLVRAAVMGRALRSAGIDDLLPGPNAGRRLVRRLRRSAGRR